MMWLVLIIALVLGGAYMRGYVSRRSSAAMESIDIHTMSLDDGTSAVMRGRQGAGVSQVSKGGIST